MPQRDVYEAAGKITGIVAACAAARKCESGYNLALMVGGYFGGWAGGRMPDILEPSLKCPDHRQFFHSVACNGGTAAAGVNAFVAWAEQRVAAAHALPNATHGSINWQKVIDLFVAGLMIGFVAGYASHIVLDACTARSLPLW